MANMNRRVSGSASSSAKRPSSENYAAGKPTTAVTATQQAKKRVALGNISNQASVLRRTNKEATVRPPSVKRASIAQIPDSSLVRLSSTITTTKPSVVFKKSTPVPVKDVHIKSVVPCLAPCSNDVTSCPSERGSPSFDESMSTCDSIRSADIEYIDNADSSAVASLERQASVNLHISDDSNEAGCGSKSDVCVDMETDLSVGNVDNNLEDPQLCATIACDIYNHLRQVESKKRPSVDFMEVVQKDINPSMRAILIDWLVEVSEEYRLVPDTLYLTVNYIDRYLSGNEMNRQRLQLLGVACMLIASKYEEICAPQVEEFCYITDNTYFRDEVLEMEAAVLKHLKFEMTATTAKCFLRRFVNAAQWGEEAPSLHLEFLASYAAELTLPEYDFLRYAPSLIAASAVFLAKFILQPAKRPWNATMCHYTMYMPSELCECVKAMHQLFRNSPNINLPAIREKYSQHKYKFVAKKYCPPLIPQAYFQDLMK